MQTSFDFWREYDARSDDITITIAYLDCSDVEESKSGWNTLRSSLSELQVKNRKALRFQKTVLQVAREMKLARRRDLAIESLFPSFDFNKVCGISKSCSSTCTNC